MIGRKNAILIGLVVLALSTMALGLLSLFDNMWYFFSFSMLARFLQGAGCALAGTAGNLIIIKTYVA